jgi:hypothetical protein
VSALRVYVDMLPPALEELHARDCRLCGHWSLPVTLKHLALSNCELGVAVPPGVTFQS